VERANAKTPRPKRSTGNPEYYESPGSPGRKRAHSGPDYDPDGSLSSVDAEIDFSVPPLSDEVFENLTDALGNRKKGKKTPGNNNKKKDAARKPSAKAPL
jgi:hypothetical protein